MADNKLASEGPTKQQKEQTPVKHDEQEQAQPQESPQRKKSGRAIAIIIIIAVVAIAAIVTIVALVSPAPQEQTSVEETEVVEEAPQNQEDQSDNAANNEEQANTQNDAANSEKSSKQNTGSNARSYQDGGGKGSSYNTAEYSVVAGDPTITSQKSGLTSFFLPVSVTNHTGSAHNYTIKVQVVNGYGDVINEVDATINNVAPQDTQSSAVYSMVLESKEELQTCSFKIASVNVS